MKARGRADSVPGRAEGAARRVAADGTLTGTFKVEKDGFYRIELDAPSGERVSASPQYTIDVLTDQPPTVSISKPGRDTTASPIEEVFVEARAEDDFGVKDLELVYSVNGGGGEDDPPVRRQEAAGGGLGRPHVLSRGAGRQGRRLRVRTTRRPPTTTRSAAEASDERHLLRADPSAQQGVQARAVRRGAAAAVAGAAEAARSARSPSSSGRSSPRRSTSSAIARR